MKGFKDNVYDTLQDGKLTIDGTPQRDIEDEVDRMIERAQMNVKRIILTAQEQIELSDNSAEKRDKIKSAILLYI